MHPNVYLRNKMTCEASTLGTPWKSPREESIFQCSFWYLIATPLKPNQLYWFCFHYKNKGNIFLGRKKKKSSWIPAISKSNMLNSIWCTITAGQSQQSDESSNRTFTHRSKHTKSSVPTHQMQLTRYTPISSVVLAGALLKSYLSLKHISGSCNNE